MRTGVRMLALVAAVLCLQALPVGRTAWGQIAISVTTGKVTPTQVPIIMKNGTVVMVTVGMVTTTSQSIGPPPQPAVNLNALYAPIGGGSLDDFLKTALPPKSTPAERPAAPAPPARAAAYAAPVAPFGRDASPSISAATPDSDPFVPLVGKYDLTLRDRTELRRVDVTDRGQYYTIMWPYGLLKIGKKDVAQMDKAKPAGGAGPPEGEAQDKTRVTPASVTLEKGTCLITLRDGSKVVGEIREEFGQYLIPLRYGNVRLEKEHVVGVTRLPGEPRVSESEAPAQ